MYLTTGYYAPRHFSRLFHFPLTRVIIAPPSHRLSGLLDLVLGRAVGFGHATYLRKYVIMISETIAPRLAPLTNKALGMGYPPALPGLLSKRGAELISTSTH